MDKRKGVICSIEPPERMPVAKDGTRADIVVDGAAAVSRMILSRMYETYINAASRHVEQGLKQVFNITGNESNILDIINQTPINVFEDAWAQLMMYYQMVSPKMASLFITGQYPSTPQQHMAYILSHDISLWFPTNNEVDLVNMVKSIETAFQPPYDVVTYKDRHGNHVTSKNKVRISSFYFLLLEKTVSDWSAIASGKLQQHGLLAPLSSVDKYTQPVRQQPPRTMDEAVIRNFACYVGDEWASDVLDRNNNPELHCDIVRNILLADQPTNVESLVDRMKFPIGYSKPLQMMKHIAFCNGYSFKYVNVNRVGGNQYGTITAEIKGEV